MRLNRLVIIIKINSKFVCLRHKIFFWYTVFVQIRLLLVPAYFLQPEIGEIKSTKNLNPLNFKMFFAAQLEGLKVQIIILFKGVVVTF